METFEIRLLVKKKRIRRKVDRFHSLCRRGEMYFLEIVHSYFPRTLFCWPSSYRTVMISLGKHQYLKKGSLSKLRLAEPALTAQGSAFAHTYVKDCLQKPIQLSDWFPKLLVISPSR